MLTVAAPSGTGGTRAAVTDGGGGAGMQCASSRLWPAGWRVPPAALERTGLADMRAAAERAVRGLFWCACDEGQGFLGQRRPVLAGCCV